MDPDANLKEQLELAESIQQAYDNEEEVDPDDAARLAELVIALNGWMKGCGFLPKEWRQG